MSSGKSWWSRLFSRDARRSERKPTSSLGAYFWNGNRPVKIPVRDISETGLYLLTEERLYPGTVVMMTLQDAEATEESERIISVQSKAVRAGEDGMGLEFILPKKEKKFFAAGREGADRKTMRKFLTRLWGRNT